MVYYLINKLKLKKMFTLSLMPNFKGTVKEFIICCSILMIIDSTYLIPMFNALNK